MKLWQALYCCFIYRISEGQIHEVIEYLDTELLTRALGSLD